MKGKSQQDKIMEGLIALLRSLIFIFRKIGRHRRILSKGVILAAMWKVDYKAVWLKPKPVSRPCKSPD